MDEGGYEHAPSCQVHTRRQYARRERKRKQMQLEFFEPCIVPDTTAQEKQITVQHGVPVVYDTQEIKQVKALFRDMAARANPAGVKLEGPVKLKVSFIYQADAKHPAGSWKVTRPDTDNILKAFKDSLTVAGWWADDSQVVSEHVYKFYGVVPGILCSAETLEGGVET